MAEKKITKKEKNELIIAVLGGEKILTDEERKMLIEHITHEIELLDKKTSKSATLTPAQKDNLAIADILRDILAECSDEKGMTVGALLKDERIKAYKCGKDKDTDVSSQKITAIFTQNPKDFKRIEEKKVAYYSLNYGVEGEGEGE